LQASPQSGSNPSLARTLIEQFDNAELIAAVPDHELRAAFLVIEGSAFGSHLVKPSSPPGNVPRWPIRFSTLPQPIPATFQVSHEGHKEVQINSMLSGDSLEVIAAAIVEGMLLESGPLTPNAAVIAALFSTICYASLAEQSPEIVSAPTWGTISRNIDLLALLNSSPWSVSSGGADVAAIGFLTGPSSPAGALPGTLFSAESFNSYVSQSPRAAGTAPVFSSPAPELLITVAGVAGIALGASPAGPVVSSETMRNLDRSVGVFMSVSSAAKLAEVLALGVAS
jgi:hypothetical protein